MRYLLSEVEFYIPTLKDFEKSVVVIRRDQLEGAKLYIAPKDLVFASAQFGSNSENTCSIPKFADIILLLIEIDSGLTVNYNINDPDTISLHSGSGKVSKLKFIADSYLLITDDVSEVREFIQLMVDNVGPVYIATSDYFESEDSPEPDEEENEEEEGEERKEEKEEVRQVLPVSEAEASSILEDSKEYLNSETSEEKKDEGKDKKEEEEKVDKGGSVEPDLFDDLGEGDIFND